MIVWTDTRYYVPDPADVFARRFNPLGAAISDDFKVNASEVNREGGGRIAIATDGSALATWGASVAFSEDRL